MSKLEVESLSVSYVGQRGTVNALSDFTLTVPEGGMTVLLGESGCGKSTALNSVAGLLRPDRGRIRLGDDELFAGEEKGRLRLVPPNKRDIGMVFQSYALWPHLTALDNVAYPLKRRKTPTAEAEKRARQALATVRCDRLAERFPAELSGGQQQRIALARALVAEPRLVLFDEPLSNLDASLRRGLRDELSRLHRDIGFTGLYVTHDQAEALSLGSAIAVMDHGRIVQEGPPEVVYSRPETEFVARFFGANVTSGRAVGKRRGTTQLDTPFGTISTGGEVGGDGEVKVAFMPHAVTILPDPDGPASVVSEMYVGASREVSLAASGHELLAVQSVDRPAIGVGARVRIKVDPKATFCFSR